MAEPQHRVLLTCGTYVSPASRLSSGVHKEHAKEASYHPHQVRHVSEEVVVPVVVRVARVAQAERAVERALRLGDCRARIAGVAQAHGARELAAEHGRVGGALELAAQRAEPLVAGRRVLRELQERRAVRFVRRPEELTPPECDSDRLNCGKLQWECSDVVS